MPPKSLMGVPVSEPYSAPSSSMKPLSDGSQSSSIPRLGTMYNLAPHVAIYTYTVCAWPHGVRKNPWHQRDLKVNTASTATELWKWGKLFNLVSEVQFPVDNKVIMKNKRTANIMSPVHSANYWLLQITSVPVFPAYLISPPQLDCSS